MVEFILILFAVWLIIQIAGCGLEMLKGWRDARSKRHKNHIVINGRMYWPERTGHKVDCDKECKLHNHCRKDGYGICVTLQHPYDDVIMTDGEDGR